VRRHPSGRDVGVKEVKQVKVDTKVKVKMDGNLETNAASLPNLSMGGCKVHPGKQNAAFVS
jgi:hypothetical protein